MRGREKISPDDDTPGVLYVDGWTSPDVPDGVADDWWGWVVDAVLSAGAPMGRIALESGCEATEAQRASRACLSDRNPTRAAEALGINRATLHRKLKRYGGA